MARHQFGQLNWILGEVPTSDTGFGCINYWKDGWATDDNISVVFTYPSGVLLTQTVILSNKHYGVVEQIIGEPITKVGPIRSYDISTKEGPKLWFMPILDVAMMGMSFQYWSEMEKEYQSQLIRWSLVYGPNDRVISLSPNGASSCIAS